jgi:tetratricopeptide (TPR) repeat protein
MNSLKPVKLAACVTLLAGGLVSALAPASQAYTTRSINTISIAKSVNVLAQTEPTPQAEQWYKQAWELIDASKPAQALALFDRILTQYPNHAPTLAGRGQALYDLQRYPEAIAVLKQALKLDAEMPFAWMALGNALDDGGQTQVSLNAYDRALQLKPKYAAAWYNKGVALGRLQRYKDAIAAYDQAIAIEPQFESAWYNRGVTLARLERYPEAIAAYDQTLKINPNNKKAQNNREILLRQVGQVPRKSSPQG